MPMETVIRPVHFNKICHGGATEAKSDSKEVQEKEEKEFEKRGPQINRIWYIYILHTVLFSGQCSNVIKPLNIH